MSKCDHQFIDNGIAYEGPAGLITSAAHCAQYACIPCIKRAIHTVDNLPDDPRPDHKLSSRKSAGRAIVRIIADSHARKSDKIAAILWCLDRGFLPSQQIFEQMFPLNPKRLAQLAKRGAVPNKDNLNVYAGFSLWKHIEAIRNNVPETFQNEDDETVSRNDYVAEIDYLFYKRDFPIAADKELQTHFYDDLVNCIMQYATIE